MISKLFAMFIALAVTIPGRVLVGLGIGWLSYASLTALVNQLVGTATNAYLSLSGFIYSLLSLAGFTNALGIITAAMVTRASLIGITRLGKIL